MGVGYSWKEDEKSGILQVTFQDETCEIPYGREELQDLAIETYALRPCIMRSVADVMPTEMRSIHNIVHDHFNGIGQSARRNSTIILRKLKMNQVDEAQLVPVFNIENTRVEYLPIEHILNFVFYFQGKRRAPQGASVPTALFTEPVGPPTPESTPLQSGSNDTEILQQLYDSDDDLVPIDSTQEETQAPRAKRDRDLTQEAPADRGQGRLIALRRRLDDDPEMVRDIDQLIALRQAGLGKGSSSSLVATAGSDTKLQFKPSRQQAVTHGALVNVQRVTSLKVDAALKPPAARNANTRFQRNQRNSNGSHQIPVPPEVVAALPIRKNKKLCMKYLSADGCPGKGDKCVFDYRGYFDPPKLPGIVKRFIEKAYGGLRVRQVTLEGDESKL
ncbi:hypothetical protein PF006_g8743 [Phytophthora fragariae]|uniref:Uncharacterized protein n=1 Tax=Phytophthora fragariae TaxID=53985 RepID=A0A6A3UHI9_9STRA|nr:hypothetical protein PF006_g8743 [Phytophthora fragariae]